mmetsp:Transcript_122093/g.352921  ORF Transcript_122093/g.352921 Transcript_122093/m.352921 type:complete len:169 (+) Transcript_122093:120-626(+)
MFPMPAGASITMKVHHWVVVIACVLAILSPSGFGLFVMGSFALELGSLTFNLRTLYPRYPAISILYQVCMLLSNIAGFLVGVQMLQISNIQLWMKLLFFVADVGVCIGRQMHALKDAGCIRKHSHKNGAKASPVNGSASAAPEEKRNGSVRARHQVGGGDVARDSGGM